MRLSRRNAEGVVSLTAATKQTQCDKRSGRKSATVLLQGAQGQQPVTNPIRHLANFTFTFNLLKNILKFRYARSG